MPQAAIGHAAAISKSSQPSQMEQSPAVTAPPHRLLEIPLEQSSHPDRIPPVGEASLAVSGAVEKEGEHIDKKSFSYIVRSGVAGGLAGCAVSRRQEHVY